MSVSGLRARLRFRDGNAAGATSDLLAAMAAARHLSVDGSLASVLVGVSVSRPCTETRWFPLGSTYGLLALKTTRVNTSTNDLW